MKQNKILLSILFAFLLIVIPSKALVLTNLTQEDFYEVNEEKGISYVEQEGYYGYLLLKNGEYVLDEDIEINAYILVKKDSEIFIDLNGKTISSSNESPLVFGVDGKLTLTGKGTVGKKVISKDELSNIVVDSYFGEIIIDDITSNGEVITNYGKLTINNGTFNGLYLEGLVDVTINGGTFNKGLKSFGLEIAIDEDDENQPSEEEKELNSAPTIIYMDGGDIPLPIDDDEADEEQIKNSSLVINDGKFTGASEELRIFNMDNVTINGGTFNANVNAVVIIAKNIKLSGGLYQITENNVFTKYYKDDLRTAVGLRGDSIELSGGKYVSDENGYSIAIQSESENVFEEALKKDLFIQMKYLLKNTYTMKK